MQPPYPETLLQDPLADDVIDSLLEAAEGPVFDPFAGCGRVLRLAARKGLDARGTEPFGVFTHWYDFLDAACQADEGLFEKTATDLLNLLRTPDPAGPKHRAFPYTPAVQAGFHRTTLQDLGYLLDYAAYGKTPTAVRTLLSGCALPVLPELLQEENPVSQHPAPPVKNLHAHLEEAVRKTAAYKAWAPAEDGRRRLVNTSALGFMPFLGAASIGAVVSQPPHFNSRNLITEFSLQLAWLGHHPGSLRNLSHGLIGNQYLASSRHTGTAFFYRRMPGNLKAIDQVASEVARTFNIEPDAALRHYVHDMAQVVFQCRRVLRPGGTACLVLEQPHLAPRPAPYGRILNALAAACGFQVDSAASPVLRWRKP